MGMYPPGEARELAMLRSEVLGALVGLARATEGNEYLLTGSTHAVVIEGLCATLPGSDFGREDLRAMLQRVDGEKRKLVPDCYVCAAACGKHDAADIHRLLQAGQETGSIKMLLMLGAQRIAACCAAAPAAANDRVLGFLYKALIVLGLEDWSVEDILPVAMEAGEISARCMGHYGGRDDAFDI